MYWKHVDDLMKDQRDVVSRIRDFNSYANKKSIRILKKDPRSSTFLNNTNHVKDSNKKGVMNQLTQFHLLKLMIGMMI